MVCDDSRAGVTAPHFTRDMLDTLLELIYNWRIIKQNGSGRQVK